MGENIFFTSLPYLYQSVAVIGAIGYLPQIYTLAKAQDDCHDISLATWFIWISTWIISFLYGVFFLNDWRFLMIAGVNITGHIVVIGLTVYNRFYKFKKTI